MEKMHIHQPDEGSPYHALLTDEIERLRADAERYRWLRERARSGRGNQTPIVTPE